MLQPSGGLLPPTPPPLKPLPGAPLRLRQYSSIFLVFLQSIQAVPRTVRFDKRRPQTLELDCPSSVTDPESGSSSGGGGGGGAFGSSGEAWRKKWRRGRRKRKKNRRRKLRRLQMIQMQQQGGVNGGGGGVVGGGGDGDSDVDVEGMVDVYL